MSGASEKKGKRKDVGCAKKSEKNERSGNAVSCTEKSERNCEERECRERRGCRKRHG